MLGSGGTPLPPPPPPHPPLRPPPPPPPEHSVNDDPSVWSGAAGKNRVVAHLVQMSELEIWVRDPQTITNRNPWTGNFKQSDGRGVAIQRGVSSTGQSGGHPAVALPSHRSWLLSFCLQHEHTSRLGWRLHVTQSC